MTTTIVVPPLVADQIINQSPGVGLRVPTANVGAPEASTRSLVYTPDLTAAELAIFNRLKSLGDTYDPTRDRAQTVVGWAPFAVPLNYDPALAFTSSSTLAANGGSVAVPMLVPSHMLLEKVLLRSNDTATARTWGWDLYVERLNNGNVAENALDRVASSSANETFTPSAASTRSITAAAAPVYIAPGLYWLVVQCRHATNNFSVGATAVSAVAATLANANQAKTTTNPNGATLDFVAATWTKSTGIVGVSLQGRVFGQTSAWT